MLMFVFYLETVHNTTQAGCNIYSLDYPLHQAAMREVQYKIQIAVLSPQIPSVFTFSLKCGYKKLS